MAALSSQYNEYIRTLLDNWHDSNGILTTRQPDALTIFGTPSITATATGSAGTLLGATLNVASRPRGTNVWSRQSVDAENPLLYPIKDNLDLTTENKFYYELAVPGTKNTPRREQPRVLNFPKRSRTVDVRLTPTFINRGANQELVY